MGADVCAVIKSRTSEISSGRWTKETATQSGFLVNAYSKSALSLGVSTDVLISVSGKLNPRRDQISFPLITIARTTPGLTCFTCISILPSFNNILSPTFNDSMTSGCGKKTRSEFPGTSFESKVKICPGDIGYFSSVAKLPIRCFGPCKSTKIPTGTPNFLEILRTESIFLPCTSPVS